MRAVEKVGSQHPAVQVLASQEEQGRLARRKEPSMRISLYPPELGGSFIMSATLKYIQQAGPDMRRQGQHQYQPLARHTFIIPDEFRIITRVLIMLRRRQFPDGLVCAFLPQPDLHTGVQHLGKPVQFPLNKFRMLPEYLTVDYHCTSIYFAIHGILIMEYPQDIPFNKISYSFRSTCNTS